MWLFRILALTGALSLDMARQLEITATSTPDVIIRASPQRVVLGSLTYGGPESTVLVREVKIEGLSHAGALDAIDLSHAQGVQVLDRRETDEGTILRLGINIAQFTKGEPYGIFIKRPVRLEINSADQPQLILPIEGWTAVNKTSRNFNDYLFAGHERWEGIWGTPHSWIGACPVLTVANRAGRRAFPSEGVFETMA